MTGYDQNEEVSIQPTEQQPKVAAAEPAGIAAPSVAPAGKLSIPGADPFALSPEQERALPLPPEGYTPGPTSPVRHAYEDNILFKIGTALSSFGEQIPTNMKIKIAQQEADIAKDTNKRGWDNYFQNNVKTRAMMQQHMRDQQMAWFQVLPMMKAHLSMIDQKKDPKGYADFLEHFVNSSESMWKGGGAAMQYIGNNLASVYDGDDLLSADDDPANRDMARQQVQQMGYPEWMQSKERVALSLSRNQARLNMGQLHFSHDDLDLLKSGKMTEEQFRTSYKQMLLDQRQSGPASAAARHFLDTPEGQKRMNAMGVKTDSMEYAQDLKHKELDGIAQAKAERFKRNQDIVALEDSPKGKGVQDPGVVAEARQQINQTLGLEQKDAAANQLSQNNPLAIALHHESGGKFDNPYTMLKGIDPHSKEYGIRMGYYNKAMEYTATSKAQGSLDVKLAAQHDLMKEPLFKVGKDGWPEKVKGFVSQMDYMAGQAGFSMSTKQQEQMADLQAQGERGVALFKQADKAYTAMTPAQQVAQVAAELAAGNDVTGSLTAKFAPNIYNYVAARDSALGKFARALGGEVGVLTDQDVARVRRMFDTAADTSETRAAKARAFSQLIDINKRSIMRYTMNNNGTAPTGAALESLKEENKDAVSGVLGSVEDKVNRQSKGTEAKSLAEPADGSSKAPVSRANALRDRMVNKIKGTP